MKTEETKIHQFSEGQGAKDDEHIFKQQVREWVLQKRLLFVAASSFMIRR